MKFGIMGHSIVDTILFSENIPTPNTSTRVIEMRDTWGGIGANISAHCGNVGLDVRLYSVIGNDFPLEFERHLERMGVDLSGMVRLEDGRSPKCLLVTAEEDQVALVYQGVYEKDTERVLGAFPQVDDLDVMHITSGPPDVYTKLVSEFKGKVHLDPAQEIHYIYDKEKFMPLFERCDAMFSNESEASVAAKFLGVDTPEEIAKKVDMYVLTRSSKGSTVLINGEASNVPSYKTNVVDTTGAGDAFRAGFLWGMDLGEDPVDCAIRGGALGSFIVEKVGPQSVFPKKEQIEERMEVIRSGV